MSILNPVGMNSLGQLVIAQPGDTFLEFAAVASTGDYGDLLNKPTIPSAVQADWTEGNSGAQAYIQHKPTALSAFSNDTGFITSAALGSYVTSSSLTTTLGSYATSSALTSGLSAKQGTITTGTTAQYLRGDLSLATFPAIPSTVRTTSTLTLSLVGTGATGTQISATNDSSVRLTCSTSTTSTIGGPSTSLVTLKICSTNNSTEASWTPVATLENDQTITLAVVLNSIQVLKGQLCADLPAGWYVKLVNSGTGTHTEGFVSGQQTIYG